MADLEIKVQALDGTWETLGVDRYPGIVPEAFTATANERGPDTCAFVLRRPTDQEHPDLSAFTPCEVYVGGALVWEGRIRETPTQEGADAQINVSGVGWQAQLDDDQYERMYVQADMTAWKDGRSFLTADLTLLKAAPQVNVDGGGITILWPQGTASSVGNPSQMACATLDLGPDPGCWAKRVVATLAPQALAGNWTVTLRGHDTPEGVISTTIPGTEDAWSAVNPGAGTVAGTFTAQHRYVSLLIFYSVAVAGTSAADQGIKATALTVFSDTAYETGNASALKASQVITDGLDRACPLLSADRSLVQATTFSIPDFTPDGPHTVRDNWDAVNAFHRWRGRIVAGRRPEFSPQPNAPVVKVGDWPGARFTDASAGSGEEIYNRVVVTGTKPDGTPLRVERWARSAWDATRLVQVANPSATVDASAWTPLDGTVARDTITVNSPPGAFRVGSIASLSTLRSATVAQPLKRRKRYRLNLAANVPVASQGILITIGSATAPLAAPTILSTGGLPANVWTSLALEFTPPADLPDYYIQFVPLIGPGASATWLYFDDVSLEANASSLVDRRDFVHTKQLPVSSSLDDAGGAQVCDVFLSTHQRTPLKGTLAIDGPGGVRDVLTDEPVHPAEMLTKTTELIRMANRVDPDTGALGRDGIIAQAAYVHDSESATVQVDNDRTSLDALLARFASVTGRGAS